MLNSTSIILSLPHDKYIAKTKNRDKAMVNEMKE